MEVMTSFRFLMSLLYAIVNGSTNAEPKIAALVINFKGFSYSLDESTYSKIIRSRRILVLILTSGIFSFEIVLFHPSTFMMKGSNFACAANNSYCLGETINCNLY